MTLRFFLEVHLDDESIPAFELKVNEVELAKLKFFSLGRRSHLWIQQSNTWRIGCSNLS